MSRHLGKSGRTGLASLLALAFALSASARAQAQSGFNGQRYEPAVGAAGGLQVERPNVPRHLGFSFGLYGNYSSDAVVIRQRSSGEILSRPLSDALTLDLLASLGLFGWLELGMDLPIHAVYEGEGPGPGSTLAGRGVGDLRFVPKVSFTRNGRSRFTFGAALPVTLPTGDEAALRGSGVPTLTPKLLAGLRGGRWAANANAGVRLRPGGADETLGHELVFAAGGHLALWPRRDVLDLMVEAVSGTYLTNRENVSKVPVELLSGLSIKPHADWAIDVGGGVGLSRGVADPRFRVLAGVRFTPQPVSGYQDSDQDGVSDAVDRCRYKEEDQDGFQDDDGCPESDNDRDGVPDERDECPDQAQGPVAGEDGCPEGDVFLESGRIFVKGKVQFETGSASLKPKSERLLDRVATLLKRNPQIKRVRIEGHTDEVGPSLTNQQLSEIRAASVKSGLVRRGIAAERLETRGYGETRPVAPNKTAAGRAKNRRVEFVLID